MALLFGAALATMAFAAPAASAATVVKDAAGNLCPAISPAKGGPYKSGGCTVKMTAEVNGNPIYIGVGFHAVSCYINYTLHVGPDGNGILDEFSHVNPGCGGWKLRS
ncbi:MAG TPA: hypothetical protein VEW07_08335, partial [Solirubrobacterales bacterium]|nr:hypothetical protein [Solirubrobacterales bacterium]